MGATNQSPEQVAQQAIDMFIDRVKALFPWTGLADLDGAQLERCRDEALQEIEEGLGVHDEDISP